MYKEYELLMGPDRVTFQRGKTTVTREGNTTRISGPDGITVSRLHPDGSTLSSRKVMERIYAWLAERGEKIVFAYDDGGDRLTGELVPSSRSIVVATCPASRA